MKCPICCSNIYGNSCLKCGYVKKNEIVDHHRFYNLESFKEYVEE